MTTAWRSTNQIRTVPGQSRTTLASATQGSVATRWAAASDDTLTMASPVRIPLTSTTSNRSSRPPTPSTSTSSTSRRTDRVAANAPTVRTTRASSDHTHQRRRTAGFSSTGSVATLSGELSSSVGLASGRPSIRTDRRNRQSPSRVLTGCRAPRPPDGPPRPSGPPRRRPIHPRPPG